jgi:hypothetical protein
MTTSARVTAHTLELLRWIAARPRTYCETIDAWRTSCPRLSVWDDAIGDGLVEVVRVGRQDDAVVVLTASGQAAVDPHSARDGASR